MIFTRIFVVMFTVFLSLVSSVSVHAQADEELWQYISNPSEVANNLNTNKAINRPKTLTFSV